MPDPYEPPPLVHKVKVLTPRRPLAADRYGRPVAVGDLVRTVKANVFYRSTFERREGSVLVTGARLLVTVRDDGSGSIAGNTVIEYKGRRYQVIGAPGRKGGPTGARYLEVDCETGLSSSSSTNRALRA